MSDDLDALNCKKQEIADFAERIAASKGAASASLAQSAVEAFSLLTAPEKPEVLMHLITVSMLNAPDGRGPTGRSRKLGNLVLNWRKLIDIVPDAAIAAAGATAAPAWLLPLIGLYVWNKLWRGSEEELTEVEATTILSLWKYRNEENKIAEDDGFTKTNLVRASFGLQSLSGAEYRRSIDRLLEMECVEMSDGVIWLREWVRKTYQ